MKGNVLRATVSRVLESFRGNSNSQDYGIKWSLLSAVDALEKDKEIQLVIMARGLPSRKIKGCAPVATKWWRKLKIRPRNELWGKWSSREFELSKSAVVHNPWIGEEGALTLEMRIQINAFWNLEFSDSVTPKCCPLQSNYFNELTLYRILHATNAEYTFFEYRWIFTHFLDRPYTHKLLHNISPVI